MVSVVDDIESCDEEMADETVLCTWAFTIADPENAPSSADAVTLAVICCLSESLLHNRSGRRSAIDPRIDNLTIMLSQLEACKDICTRALPNRILSYPSAVVVVTARLTNESDSSEMVLTLGSSIDKGRPPAIGVELAELKTSESMPTTHLGSPHTIHGTV